MFHHVAWEAPRIPKNNNQHLLVIFGIIHVQERRKAVVDKFVNPGL